MKNPAASKKSSYNPMIGPGARLGGPVYGGNAHAFFPNTDPEITQKYFSDDSRTHTLLNMFYGGSSVFDEIEKDRKKKYAREKASHAGKAKRTDPLSKCIDDIVAQNPKISEKKLMRALQNSSHGSECDLEIDEETELITYNKVIGKSTRLMEHPLTVLKDRLSRSKKKFRANTLAR